MKNILFDETELNQTKYPTNKADYLWPSVTQHSANGNKYINW
jgi:hypothetical protein